MREHVRARSWRQDRFCAGLCLTLLLLTGPAGTRVQAEPGPGPGVGQDAPSFMLLNLDNRYVSLRDLVGDRAKTPAPVIANFWATWCAPCRKELPHLLETTAGYGDKVRVLLIAENKMSEREQVAAFAREQGLATKVLLDPYQKTAEKYGVTKIPVTFVIDPTGKLVATIYPGDDPSLFKKTLQKAVNSALKTAQAVQ